MNFEESVQLLQGMWWAQATSRTLHADLRLLMVRFSPRRDLGGLPPDCPGILLPSPNSPSPPCYYAAAPLLGSSPLPPHELWLVSFLLFPCVPIPASPALYFRVLVARFLSSAQEAGAPLLPPAMDCGLATPTGVPGCLEGCV